MKRINLLPPEIAERRRVQRRGAALFLIGALVVGLLAVVWVLRQAQLNGERDRLDRAEAQVRTLEARRRDLQEFADLEARVAQKELSLAVVMTDDVHWSRLLTELSMVIPEEAWLTNLSGDVAVAGEEEAAAGLPAPARLGSLTFTAVTFEFPDVAKWIIRLQGMKSLQNVWVTSAERAEIGTRDVVNFNSTTDLSADAASGRYKQGAPR